MKRIFNAWHYDWDTHIEKGKCDLDLNYFCLMRCPDIENFQLLVYIKS